MKWHKKIHLSQNEKANKETWLRTNQQQVEEYELEIYLGKKTNLLDLKQNIIGNIQEKIDYYQASRSELYQGETELVKECPVTGITVEKCTEVANVYGAKYVQTPDTGHIFVKNRPTKNTIHDFYLNNVTYAATYTDKKSAESRLQAIAIPWAEWMIEVFQKTYHRPPKKILDVGSGAGHFVEACRRKGMDADGIELSASSREFAQKIWGFEMDSRNFIEAAVDYKDYDVVTFWGLLEHTPNPSSILSAAYSMFENSNSGMVISKLPRWESLSSSIQRLSTECIIRHIDPMGHIMLFTDASAAEIYVRNNFKPIAAWYYGMDVYELLMQIGNKVGNYSCLLDTGELQMELQQCIDNARFSDGLTLVGIPNKV